MGVLPSFFLKSQFFPSATWWMHLKKKSGLIENLFYVWIFATFSKQQTKIKSITSYQSNHLHKREKQNSTKHKSLYIPEIDGLRRFDTTFYIIWFSMPFNFVIGLALQFFFGARLNESMNRSQTKSSVNYTPCIFDEFIFFHT